MLSLTLGLCAALMWGVHDFCVRFVSERGGIMPALTAVSVIGCFFLVPVTLFFGGWADMTGRAYLLSAVSGVFYLFAYIGLYKAFSIGPLRLAAPIVAAYPIVSVGWSALMGQAVTLDQWLAVAAVMAGVAVVSILSDASESNGRQGAAVGWAIVGALGFAMTFAVGHLATQAGAEMPVILATRLITATGAVCVLLARRGPKMPHRSAWPILVLMGLLDAVALSVVIGSGRLDRPEFAAVAASVFGVVTIILAWGILKEKMSLPQWAGVALTFLGIGYLGL